MVCDCNIMKMYRLLFITPILLFLGNVSANQLQRRCNDVSFEQNSSITIVTPGYPRETTTSNCKNYFTYHSNSSIIIFELEDVNMYYTNYGRKTCGAIAMFGNHSIPCLDDEPQCIVYTNDRYCLSDGLPRRYSLCSIYDSGLSHKYIPVHIKFLGGHGTEMECLNPNEPQSTCDKVYRMTYPRGIKMKYRQIPCRKAHETDKVLSSTTSSVLSNTASSMSNSSNPHSPAVQDKRLEPGEPNLVNGEVVDDTGRYVIMYSLIGISTIVVAAMVVGITKRYRFKNERARKRMMRNQGSTATMVNSVIYGSTPEFPSSAALTPDGTSLSAMDTSNTILQSEEGDYCYIDLDLNKNEEEGRFRFPCQYRREGVSYIPTDERKNALYEEARSFV